MAILFFQLLRPKILVSVLTPYFLLYSTSNLERMYLKTHLASDQFLHPPPAPPNIVNGLSGLLTASFASLRSVRGMAAKQPFHHIRGTLSPFSQPSQWVPTSSTAIHRPFGSGALRCRRLDSTCALTPAPCPPDALVKASADCPNYSYRPPAPREHTPLRRLLSF